ncbi:MAG: metallophosphoesterase, partial [Mogibacterium sp.]|nr:metallophosphoesterase [Mogibacterium sp.]
LISITACGKAEENTAPEEPAAAEQVPEPEPEPAVEPECVLFASDYQYEAGWVYPSTTVERLFTAVKDAGLKPEGLIYCGDYTNLKGLNKHETSPEGSIEEIRQLAAEAFPDLDPDRMVFIQGNHDAMTESLAETGLYDYGDYLVYVLGTEFDFPWLQGQYHRYDTVEHAAAKMAAVFSVLRVCGETRPVFIAGHVPIHFSARTSSLHTTGDNLYSSLVFDVVNEAGEYLDIVYLFGHNHSKGWDSYLGGSSIFRMPGDTILIPVFEAGAVNSDVYREEELNFTYMNAGYTGYDNDSGADDTLTVSMCLIYPDHLEFRRYAKDGLHVLGADGAANPYKDDRRLISSDHYAVRRDSSQTVERKASSWMKAAA